MSTLSVQLWSVREPLTEDPAGTLKRLAEIGFRQVEPFGLGAPAVPFAERLAAVRTLRARLDDLGLTAPTVHVGLPADLGELAEECSILGAGTAFVAHPNSLPGFDEDTFSDTSRLDTFANALGKAALETASHGLRLGYHNHWFEWAQLPDGTTGYDRFWSRTADTLLAELDVYWAVAAGVNPAAVLAQLGGRVVAVHLKDGPARPKEPQTPIGTGRVDIPAALAGRGGIHWHIAEIDSTDLDKFELLGANARFLVENGLSTWS